MSDIELSTFEELTQYVEDNFGGEAVNPGRRQMVYLSIPIEEFDEDLIYEILPGWDGSWTDDPERVNYEGEVMVFTNLSVDSDGESLIPYEDFDDLEDDEEDLEEDEWSEDDASGWLKNDEF